jgi:hypothetical protein
MTAARRLVFREEEEAFRVHSANGKADAPWPDAGHDDGKPPNQFSLVTPPPGRAN